MKKSQIIQRKIIKTLRVSIAFLFACFMLIAISCMAMISLESGRVWVVTQVVQYLNSSSTVGIQLQGLLSPSISEWKAGNVELLSDGKKMLVVTDLKFYWNPRALFHGVIEVKRLSANTLDLYKVTTSTTSEESPQTSSFNVKDLPDFQVDKLLVDRFQVHDFSNEDVELLAVPIKLQASAKNSSQESLFANLAFATIAEHPFEFDGTVRTSDWHKLSIFGGLSEKEGGVIGRMLLLPREVDIDADFDVTIIDGEDHFTFNLEKLKFQLAQSKIQLAGDIRLNKSTAGIDFKKIRLTTDGTEHVFSGSMVENVLDVNINIHKFPLELLSLWDSRVNGGELTAKGKVVGLLENPEFSGVVSASTHYNDLPVNVKFSGLANRDSLKVDEFTAKVAEADLSANGFVDLKGSGSNFKASAKNIQTTRLKEFGVPIPEGLSAELKSADAILKGPIQNLGGGIKFSVIGEYKEQNFALDNDWRIQKSIVHVQQSTLTFQDSSISLQGSVNVQSLQGNLKIDARSISFGLVELVNVQLPGFLEGKVDSLLLVDGDLRKPKITGSANFAGSYQSLPFVVDVSGGFEKNKIFIEHLKSSVAGEEVVELVGHYQGDEFFIHVKSDHIPSVVYSALGMIPETGVFHADLTAKGSIVQPVLSGNVTYEYAIQNPMDEENAEPVKLFWNLAIVTQSNEVELIATVKRGHEKAQRVLARVPKQLYIDYFMDEQHRANMAGVPLAASIEGEFDLAALEPFLDQSLYRFYGNLTAGLTLSGSLSQPLLDGSLKISDGYYENTVVGSIINHINCEFKAKQFLLSLEACQALDGDKGRYNLSGLVSIPTVRSMGKVSVKLAVKNANLVRTPNVESEASGEISLEGDFASLHAFGNLEVAPLKVSFDAPFNNSIPSINVVEENESSETEQDESKAVTHIPMLKLDIDLTSSQQAYLRGRGLDVELQGKMSIRGDATKPEYDGEFKTVRGGLDIFNKKFKLTSGRVNFSNNVVSLAITAVYEKNGKRIQADVSGTNDDIKLQFTATPFMPEDEILGFIILGKSLQDITPFEALQFAAAVQTLRGGGGFDPISKTRQLLGVDSLSVESVTTEDGETGMNVGVGKYINEKVYVEFDHTPDPSQPWVGNVQIELTPKLNLESSTGGSSGIQGAELKWKSDY